MTLIEALKSGKKFRRAGDTAWRWLTENTMYTSEQILAEDWEVEETKITITESELRGRIERIITENSTISNSFLNIMDEPSPQLVKRKLLEELFPKNGEK